MTIHPYQLFINSYRQYLHCLSDFDTLKSTNKFCCSLHVWKKFASPKTNREREVRDFSLMRLYDYMLWAWDTACVREAQKVIDTLTEEE